MLKKEDDVLLAKVYDQELYQSHIDKFVGDDTIGFNKKEFIDSWIRDELIIHSSSLSKSDQDEIEILSESFKKTLAVQKQKEKYLKKQLDSEVDSLELLSAYENIKENYKLQKDIFKYHLIIVSNDHPEILDIKNYFKLKDFEDFYEALTGDIEYQSMDSSAWQNWIELSLHLPVDKLEEDDIEADYNKSIEENGYVFFLRVFDYVDKNEIAPLSYMKRRLSNAIIEKRKEKLMEEFSAKLYQSALNNNKLIIN